METRSKFKLSDISKSTRSQVKASAARQVKLRALYHPTLSPSSSTNQNKKRPKEEAREPASPAKSSVRSSSMSPIRIMSDTEITMTPSEELNHISPDTTNIKIQGGSLRLAALEFDWVFWLTTVLAQHLGGTRRRSGRLYAYWLLSALLSL